MSDVLDNPIRPNRDGESTPVPWKRVGLVEFNAHWGWLSPRLVERYPHRTQRDIFSYLMAFTAPSNNDHFFICNAGAIGLFTVVRFSLETPHVEEQFCLCDNPPDRCDFAEKLYEPAGNWVRRLGIRDFVYMRCSDAASDFVARREARALGQRTDKAKIMVMEDKRGS
jgi:hypothetical protein